MNLKEVPHYSTICKAVKRLKEEDLKRSLEESAKLLGVKLEVLAVDFTGLRDDQTFTTLKEAGRRGVAGLRC